MHILLLGLKARGILCTPVSSWCEKRSWRLLRLRKSLHAASSRMTYVSTACYRRRTDINEQKPIKPRNPARFTPQFHALLRRRRCCLPLSHVTRNALTSSCARLPWHLHGVTEDANVTSRGDFVLIRRPTVSCSLDLFTRSLACSVGHQQSLRRTGRVLLQYSSCCRCDMCWRFLLTHVWIFFINSVKSKCCFV